VDELGCVADMLKPDIILVTESWCNSDVSNAFLSIDGYEIIPDLRMDRENTAGGRGGGLLVYARESVKILKLDKEIDFTQYCTFSVCDVTIYLVYRSPNAPPESIHSLENLFKSVKKTLY
jgi:hypothetical protein